uniref:Major facilitator superfamily (MFS) profile domain-containing protein n=1 Tax=Meloidogyne floridensis TaxID=298350 RepID=A0A915NSX8_9BILA
MDTTHLKSTENNDNNDNNSISSLNEESSSSSISNKVEDDNKLLNKTDKTSGKNEEMVRGGNEGNLMEDKIDFQPNTTKRPTEMDNNLNASSPLLDRNQSMDSSASENFYGYIVASYSLGQMIASPIVGYLSNRLKKIRHLLYIGIFLAFLGNALYLCVHLFPIEERRYALLIGRFVTGIGSSNISLLKAYASSASTQRDRSRAIALVTGGVALGMTMGPGLIDFQLNTTKRPTEMDKNLNASSPLLDRNQSQKSFKKYLNPSSPTTIIPTPTNSSINSSIDSSQHSDWRSLYICTFLTFCSAVQFSLYFSSMRQYLQIMDSSASENFYGYIVASYSLGQMIASPIVGYLSNRLKKIRHLLYIGIFLAFLGNALYLCVHLFPIEERRYALLIGRFVTGIGSSNISLLKAYASSASTQRDRSRAIALVTGGVALGMTMGPALMACIMNAVNAFCIFTYFREVYAGVISSRSQINRNEPALPKIDKRALFLCYFTRFTQMFINTNLETLGASLAMVLFAWTRTESVKYFSAASP